MIRPGSRPGRRRRAGLTLIEILTLIAALVVLAAAGIPLWRTHQLRERRSDAIDGLLAVQAAQDRHFAAHARYASGAEMHAAPPEGLGLGSGTPRGHYTVKIERDEDGLGYVAIARASKRESRTDARCQEFRLDQHGRRSASDAAGEDTSADCWNRL
jgi:type IV pilus assembly protein PilE